MSITLSIPPAIVQEIRIYAAAHNTTMSQMVRDYFAQLVGASETAVQNPADTFFAVVNRVQAKSANGWKFDRDECHERGSAK